MKNTNIEHFIYFQDTVGRNIRYYNIGYMDDDGFSGYGCDYVGGGEWQEFICVNGEVVGDGNHWDEELDKLVGCIGSEAMGELEAQKRLFFDWSDEYQPILKSAVEGAVGGVTFTNDDGHLVKVSSSDNIVVVEFGDTLAESLQYLAG